MANIVAGIAGKAAEAVGLQRRWSSGLCDCFRETQSCLDVCCCMCCSVSRQCNAIDGRTNEMDCMVCCLSACAVCGKDAPQQMKPMGG